MARKSENCCGKGPGDVSECKALFIVKDMQPIENIASGALALLTDGKQSIRGYLFHGEYHDIHSRPIENFAPTHFTLE